MNIPHHNLVNEVKNCTLCAPHLPLGPRPVFQIHPDAKILLAGQAPGIRVHKSGIPFDDESGVRLRQWLGVDEITFYNAHKFAILPMGFCYPGTGKSGDLPPRKECADNWRQPLLAQTPGIELTILIGQYAIDWHLKDQRKANLTQTVEAWQDYWPEVIPIPHPSPRNNIWLKKNSSFEKKVLPALQKRVHQILNHK